MVRYSKAYYGLLGLILLFIQCAHLKEARKSYSTNNYEQTIQLCQAAVEKDSTDVEAWFLMAQSYAATNSIDDAMKTMSSAYKFGPERDDIKNFYVDLFLIKGDNFFFAENNRFAKAYYDSAEVLMPQHLPVIKRLGDYWLAIGALDKAREKYEAYQSIQEDSSIDSQLVVISERTEKSKEFYTQGMSNMKRGRFKTARNLFCKAVAEKSDDDEVQYQLHMAEGRLAYRSKTKKGYWDAIDAFGKAALIMNELAEPHFRMAQAYEKKDSGEFTNAIDEYTKAAELEPEGPLAQAARKKARELKARKDKLDKFWGRKK